MNEESLRWVLRERGTWRRARVAVQERFIELVVARKFTNQAQVFEAWDWFIDGHNTPDYRS